MNVTTPNVDTIICGDCLEEMKKLPDISRNSRREQAKIFCVEEILPDALDEIERLRAENAWLKSDREFQSEEQAARIAELERAISLRDQLITIEEGER